MKNHIIFKFIAVILCAASLMGALGSVLGISLLASAGLYDVSVRDMVSTQVSQDSAAFADWLAKNYAGTELGGASDALVNAHYGSHWFASRYDPAHYGYTILDAEGSELLSLNPELKDRSDLYANESFTASGKYLHVVELESENSQLDRLREEREALLGSDAVLDGSAGTIPAEGTVVEQVIFAGSDGQPILEAWDDGDHVIVSHYQGNYIDNQVLSNGALGFLFYSTEGNLVFHSYFDYPAVSTPGAETEVYEAYFTFREGQVRLHQSEPVGRLYLNDSGRLMFLSQQPLMAPAAEEETVPEATAETLPPETTAPTEETTPVEETVPVEETYAAEETYWSEESDSDEEGYYDEEAYSFDGDWEEYAALYTAETLSTEPVIAETTPAETVPAETVPAETVPEETIPEETIPEPVLINGKPLNEYQVNSTSYMDPQQGENMTAKFVYLPMPDLTVEVYMTEAALRHQGSHEALALLQQFRDYLLPIAGICLLIFAVFSVYLCTAAARKPKTEEVRAGGLNRLPLDLYLLVGGFGAACCIVLGGQMALHLLEQDFFTGCGLLAAVGFFSCLLVVAFCFAFVAQLKTPGGFWWRNTLCGHCVRLFVKFILWLQDWLTDKAMPCCSRILSKLWKHTMVGFVKFYQIAEKAMVRLGLSMGCVGRLSWKMLHRFLKLLPITWQWMLSGVVIIFCCVLAFRTYNAFATLLCLLIPIAILLYGAHCYGTLAESTRRMSKGELNTKVDDTLMVGCFKDSAADLNALADAASLAVQNQLKSERMKTELITNVSHDIKTPLTSIINYVDLLRKPHTEAEGRQFLEVLDRQSQRLKKLIEDLMDMSKANTGNMQVELTTVDAVEAVTQALGEFSEKLDRADLTTVFRHEEDTMLMQADGRLVWRVLSNLLSNAVKYAMPGTRLYIDLTTLEGAVVISLKNISQQELRVTSEELMARFVRGDASRNTEGSGLGLNIARSLMELQQGQLQLLVDGDLFKVTLVFPGADA